MLEVTLGRSATPVALPLIDPGLDEGSRRSALSRIAPIKRQDLRAWLADLVDDPSGHWRDPWLCACALYTAPALLGAGAGELAERHAADPDPVVAETARWVLSLEE